MCGIAGIASSKIIPSHIVAIQKMLKAQEHRGPDHTGIDKINGHLVLGHNRLSIIDLSSHANQPFKSSDGRFSIVFNGEIYNYLELRQELKEHYNFQTQSDTEVLLAAYEYWGSNMLNKLTGMFAFAIHDSKSNNLFLARDRFGVKPFYYAFDENGDFYFASEIKTIHAGGVAKEQNEGLWAAYFTSGRYHFCNQTFWKNILQIEAGHYANIDLNNIPDEIQTKKWYSFAQNVHQLRNNYDFINRTKEEHLQVYKYLLEKSIKLRFRSDVTVGFNISGGLDSSVLLGGVHSLYPQKNIEAFSFYCNDERYDELPWVEKLISETNKPLNKVLLKVEDVIDRFQSVSYYQDEPFGGMPTLAYSNIFRAAREKGIFVLLDGQGMDEAWAGYDYYHNNSDSLVQGVKSRPIKPHVLNPDFANIALEESYESPFEEKLLNMQYHDLFFKKIPRALRFNDRISMMHSTELREPFLDHHLVEYAFSLPTELKMQNGKTKWALRKLAACYLKSEIVLAPKRPLQTPQREWLTEELINWVTSRVMSLKKHTWFDAKELDKEWHSFLRSNKDNTFFLWQWLSV